MRFVPLALGAMALVLGIWARLAGSPDEVTWHGRTYAIELRDEGEAVCYELVRDGEVAFRECGSTDILCDPPSAILFDVNGDGMDDLVVSTCSGTHYVTERGGELVDAKLTEPPHLGWWARQVEGGGAELLVVGLLLVAASVVPAMRY